MSAGRCTCANGHTWAADVVTIWDDAEAPAGVRVTPSKCPKCGELFVNAAESAPPSSPAPGDAENF